MSVPDIKNLGLVNYNIIYLLFVVNHTSYDPSIIIMAKTCCCIYRYLYLNFEILIYSMGSPVTGSSFTYFFAGGGGGMLKNLFVLSI